MNPDFSGVWKANLPRSKLLGPQPKVPLATIFLSLGSNLGNREKNLRTAIAALPEANVRVTHVSSFYETEPVDLRETDKLRIEPQIESRQAGEGNRESERAMN